MSVVRIEEAFQPFKNLLITEVKDPETLITTNLIITDNLNQLRLLAIEKGMQGDRGFRGEQGPVGPPGKDGITFDILPVESGGTNNTSFVTNKILFYSDNSIRSSDYSVDDLLNNSNAITGILAESGLYKNSAVDNITNIGINFGDGLNISDSKLVVDETIARKIDIDVGNLSGVLPIFKGGTNYAGPYDANRLIYFDGIGMKSFPISTGRIVFSGNTINVIAGSGLVGGGLTTLPNGNVRLDIATSDDLLVEENLLSLSVTGSPGTYTKIITDIKGRVISGTNLSRIDITDTLGYIPWHSGNDGAGSSLDADLLDGQQGSFYRNAENLTGIINTNILPDIVQPGTYTKVVVDNHGMVVYGDQNNYFDIIQALGYRPVSTTGDTIFGPVSIEGNIQQTRGTASIFDNLPIIGINNPTILPSSPRGFQFVYGGSASQTGIFAYYPVTNELKILKNVTGINFTSESSEDILFDSKAQTLYVSRFTDQTISGTKIFDSPLFVTNKLTILSSPTIPTIDPPIDVRGNSRRVINLNSDLLDGEHGVYYRNAINITGEFNYNNVIFRNLSGTPGRIPVFDSRGITQLGYTTTIQDSYIEQYNSHIAITDATNLIVGDNIVDYNAISSFAVGDDNRLASDNSAAIGSKNIVLGENSIALNENNITRSMNSLAAGKGAETWSRNQLSVGAFGQLDSNFNQINNGQFSEIALGASGVVADRAWISMSPVLSIPKNKTIAYNVEVLMNKIGGTGAAYFTFDSGIVKNSTYFNIDDPYTPRNMTTILKQPTKTEIYNDSQRRPYDFQYRIENIDDTIKRQRLIVDYPDLLRSPIDTYNVLPYYIYYPNFLSDVSATYEKTNDGITIISPEKPRSSGWFVQSDLSDEINIRCYNHNMTTGCLASLFFNSGFPHTPYSKEYIVSRILDANNFTVKTHEWQAFANNTGIVIDASDLLMTDSDYGFAFSGLVNKNSPHTIFGIDPILSSRFFRVGMQLDEIYSSESPGLLSQNNTIVATGLGSIILENSLYRPSWDNINALISISGNFSKFSKFIFDHTDRLYIDYGEAYGDGFFTQSGESWETYQKQGENNCYLLPTVGVTVPGARIGLSGYPVLVRPVGDNSGTLILFSKRNSDIKFNYIHEATPFDDRYECIYTHNESISGTSIVSIFNQKKEPVDFPSAPFSYDLVCGYGDKDNHKFKIINNQLYTDTTIEDTSNSVYKIKHLNLLYISNIQNSIYNLDYDIPSSIDYFIRLRTTDNSNRKLEKTFVFSENGNFIPSIDRSESRDLTQYYYPDSYSYDLNDLLLVPSGGSDPTKIVLDNRIESGILLGGLTTVGGYLPYINFLTATNSFSGVAIYGSNIFTEVGNISFTFPTTQITSSLDSIYIGDNLSYSNFGFVANPNVTGMLYPTVFSGTISGDRIINCSPSPSEFAATGLRIHSNLPYWYNPVAMRLQNDGSYLAIRETGDNKFYHNRIIGINNDTIILDIPYTPSGYQYAEQGYGFGPGIDGAWYLPTGSTSVVNGNFNTISKTFLLDQVYYGFSSSGFITYSGAQPQNGFNYPDLFHYYVNDVEVARQKLSCDTTISISEEKGFDFKKTYFDSGHYFTGLATLYTKASDSKIQITYNANLNIDSQKEKSFYLRFVNSTNPGSKPVSAPYIEYSGYNNNVFLVHNSYFYPDSGIRCTGTGYLNLDRNHGLSKNLPSYMINKAPVRFESSILSRNGRTPKDNLFDFDLIDDKIIINDNKHYLLKEMNKLSYFEQPIEATYKTNGFSFSGIITRNSTTVLITNLDVASNLEKNMIIHSTDFYDGYATILETDTVNNSIIIDSVPCIGSEDDEEIASDETNIWFNGNIIEISNLSTPRSYLDINDQFKIISYNNINSNAFNPIFTKYCRIINQNSIASIFSGISVGGSLSIPIKNSISPDISKKENEIRFNAPFGAVTPFQRLPVTGTISFIGAVSGYCSLPVENNICYHTYGGFTETWPRDDLGIPVLHPKTGVYSIGTSSDTCASGSLCVTIKGFKNTNFNEWIPDSVDRSSLGKNPNFYQSTELAGYVRPWGVNKKLYLDFSDDAPELNGVYYISDKLDANTFSINIPYNKNYLNRYGLVYVIDSLDNIKSNRLPNKDNIFDVVDTSIAPVGDNTIDSPIEYTIKSYDLTSKRWKHLIHFNHANETYGAETLSLNGDRSEIISISPDKIEIIKIEYSINQGLSYTDISFTNNNFKLEDTINTIIFRVTTKNGSGAWRGVKSVDAPKINIFGLSEYIVNPESISNFDPINNTWQLLINVPNLNTNFVNNKPIIFKVTDLSGSDSKIIYYSTNILPKFILPPTINVYQYENWTIPFSMDYYPGIQSTFNILDNIPGDNYDYSLENFKRPAVVISGEGISSTGLYQITALLINNEQTIATGIGNIRVWETGPPISLPGGSTKQPLPDYDLDESIVALAENSTIYLNMTQYRQTLNSTLLPSFEFYIHAKDEDAEFANYAQPSITYDLSHNNYVISQDIQYSQKSKRYIIRLTINSNKNGLFIQPINISIKQPFIRDGSTTWITYTTTKFINLCIYQNIAVTNTTVDPLPADIDSPWTFQFDVRTGTSANRSDSPPKIRLSDLPSEGSYIVNPLEYRIEKKFNYNNNQGWWTIFAYSQTNNFDEIVTNNQTGIKKISIYVEDEQSYSSGNIRLLFNRTEYLDNIKSNIYATPDNFYGTTIDMKNVSPSVNMPDTRLLILNETPISWYGSEYLERYDPDIKVLENVFTYNPIPDKWDSSITISNLNTPLDSFTQSDMRVRIKGIAQDKLYATAKLSFIELTNRPPGPIGRPIIVTGDQDFINTPQEPRLYQEGAPWELKFKTIYGLASPFHPPTILLQGTPSPCSGFNPLTEINPSCFSKIEWVGDGWKFEFSGVPLCGIAGDRTISVTALDTDNQEKIYVGSGTQPTYIRFQALDESTHPGPIISPLTENDDENITLFPACRIPISKAFKFGIRNRNVCPVPTGLSGWVVSGQLPSGLSYRINWPSVLSRPFSANPTDPQFPYSNLSSGVFEILGTPETFASGGEYPDKFAFQIFDARGRSNRMVFTFTDGTKPQETSPINYTMFFASDQPTYSPTITNISLNDVPLKLPSGLAPVKGASQFTYQPPPDPFALTCTSALENNSCMTSDFTYVSETSINYPYRYKIIPSKTSFKWNNNTTHNLSAGDILYVEINSYSQFNSRYILQVSDGNFYLDIPLFDSSSGSGRFVVSKKKNIDLDKSLNKFLFPDSSSQGDEIGINNITVPLFPNNPKYVLGCGKYIFNTSSFNLNPGEPKDFIASMGFVGPNADFSNIQVTNLPGTNKPFYWTGGLMRPKFKALLIDRTGVANGGPVEFYIPDEYQSALSKYNNESYLSIKINGAIVNSGTGLNQYRESSEGTYIRFNSARSTSDIVTYTSYGVFDIDDIELKKLSIQAVYPDTQDNGIYTIQTNSCRETGYFRISGIAMPKPYVFVPSPLPAQGANEQSAPFTFNFQQGNDFETQVAYGAGPEARLKTINQRQTKISYILYDTISPSSGNIRASGSIESSFAGSSPSVGVYTDNNTNPSGSIFHLHIFYSGDTFPNYKQQEVSGPFPRFENHYYWINKAGPRIASPQQNFFPPVIPTGLTLGDQQDIVDILCTGNGPIPPYSGIAIGGYIPVPNAESDFWDTSLFPLSGYPPYMTGIVQSDSINKPSIITNYFHSGVQQQNPSIENQYMLIGILNSFNNPIPANYGLASGHVIEVLYNNNFGLKNIYDLTTSIDEFNNVPILPSNIRTTGLLLNDSTTNISYIRVKYTGINTAISGYALINNKIEIIDKNNSTITLKHNNIDLSVTDLIDIEQNDISTSVNVSPNSQFDLLVTQKTANNIVAQIIERDNPLLFPPPSNNDTHTFDSLIVNDFCNVYKNISQAIRPTNISLDGYLWNFSLSGIVDFDGERSYKMITMENPDSPVMTANYPISPKKYFNRYRINSSRGIQISNKSVSVNSLTGNWQVILYVSGGSLPLSKYTPEVRINDSLCGFYRILDADMNDYIINNQRVIILYNDRYNTKNTLNTINVRVSDETGFASIDINLNNPD